MSDHDPNQEFTPSQINDIRRCLLPSERLEDSEWLCELCSIRMPFGKYQGKRFGEIPLRYLDETIAVMTPTWIVRRAIDLVDHAMQHGREPGTGERFEAVPNRSCDRITAEWESHFAWLEDARKKRDAERQIGRDG